MHNPPPSTPESSATLAPTSPDEAISKKRNAWIALTIIALTPVLWAVGIYLAAMLHDAAHLRRFISEDAFVFVSPLPVVAVAIFAAARHGLRHGWHLRTWILGSWSVAATCVVVLVVLAVQALVSSHRRNQDKIVLSNITRLAAAADQYYMEHRVTSVAFSQLVGPTNYLKELRIVNQETYPTRFTLGATITASGIAGTRTITYAP